MIKLREPRCPEEIGKVNDPKYCKFHRMLGHTTQNCFVLKDNHQGLADAGILTLRPKQKMTAANVTSFTTFGQMPEVLEEVLPIPEAEIQIVNTNLHCQQDKDLVSTQAPGGSVNTNLHPHLLDDLN